MENLWDECVTKHMPKTEEESRNKMIDMENFGNSGVVGQQWMAVTSSSSALQVVLNHAKSTIVLRTFTLLL